MDTPKPGQTVFQGRLDGAGAAFHDRPVVADQGRQQAGGAVAPVGLADGADALDARLVVEQNAAAAVHLNVDEAWRQQAAIEIDPLRPSGRLVDRQHRRHGGALEQRDVAIENPFAVEDPAVGQDALH